MHEKLKKIFLIFGILGFMVTVSVAAVTLPPPTIKPTLLPTTTLTKVPTTTVPPIQCSPGCECLSSEYAQQYGYSYCGGKQTICGYEQTATALVPKYCHQKPAETTTTSIAVCSGTCECLSEATAQQKFGAFTKCSNVPCGYDSIQDASVPKYCIQVVPLTDSDRDGIPDSTDNCRVVSNPNQRDTDQDSIGDVCDNCPTTFNPNQEDIDRNGKGDACDPGISNKSVITVETIPRVPKTGEWATYVINASDPDGVALIEVWENNDLKKRCPTSSCEYQSVVTGLTLGVGGTVIDGAGNIAPWGDVTKNPGAAGFTAGDLNDDDGDGILNRVDNCPQNPNPDQRDSDQDGVGDVCDQCDVYQSCPYNAFDQCGGTTHPIIEYQHPFYYDPPQYDRTSRNGCGCGDTDHGMNIFEKGFVKTETVSPDPLYQRQTDNCRYFSDCPLAGADTCSGNNLTEYVCDSTGVKYTTIQCPAVCSDGACICPDGDGGINYFTRGSLSGYTDECLNNTTLREWYCGGFENNEPIPRSIDVTCALGCQNGACVCTDTDGGRNYEVAGSIGPLSDTCACENCSDNRWLTEYYIVRNDTTSCTVENVPYECQGLCSNGQCAPRSPPSCWDGIKNQDENGIDCGGAHCLPCGRCEDTFILPSRFDWRDYIPFNVVTNQGHCGSCWAFSAVAVMEENYAMYHNRTVKLSEQNLVSCGGGEHIGGLGSCAGGYSWAALRYVKNNGIVEEGCFSYQSIDCSPYLTIWGHSDCCCGEWCAGQSCNCAYKARPCNCNAITVGGNTYCAMNGTLSTWSAGYYDDSLRYKDNSVDKAKRTLICHGPLSVYSINWLHFLLLIGYDDNNQICQDRYGTSGCWILRNSHGSDTGWYEYDGRRVWHESGYAYIPYSVNVAGEGHTLADLKNSLIWTDSVSKAFAIDDFAQADGLAMGDINGDGRDEIIHADQDMRIEIYDLNGRKLKTLHEFTDGSELSFTTGDAVVTGDVNGDGIDEIIWGDQQGWLHVFTAEGTKVLDISTTFRRWDGLAAGNVRRTGAEEIVVASQQDNLEIWDINQNMTRISLVDDHDPFNFQKGESITTGDVNGDGIEEILYGDTTNRIHILNNQGFHIRSPLLLKDFQEFDGLAAGDVNSDGQDEVIHASRSNDLEFLDLQGNRLRFMKLDFEKGDCPITRDTKDCGFGDRIAAGDINQDGYDELVVADRNDMIRLMAIFNEV